MLLPVFFFVQNRHFSETRRMMTARQHLHYYKVRRVSRKKT